MATSVARRSSVRERSPSPITCFHLAMAASARARFVHRMTVVVEVRASHGYVRLQHPSRASDRTEHMDYTVGLIWTVPRFGGRRWWFSCPLSGRRCGVLYLPRGASKFASAKGHGLDYAVTRMSKLDQAWRVGGGGPQGLVFPEERTILSMALGRENVVHLALTDPAASRRVSHAIDRWLAFIDPDAGLEGGSAAGTGTSDELIEGKE